QVHPLAQGSTSNVFHVRTAHRDLVLRIFSANGRVLDGEIDSFIRRRLAAQGCAVLAPILHSESAGLSRSGQRWCLEPFAVGRHPHRAMLLPATCRKLGQVLAALHAIPVWNFGRPARLGRNLVIGRAKDPVAGVAQRFENPIPDTWAHGHAHPVLSAIPDMRDIILAHLDQVTGRVRLGNSVICHSDLHERQMMCDGDDLVALIDFGDASLLDHHWDFGSLLYFHGPDVFRNVLAAYSRADWSAEVDPDLAMSFSVAVAMHHASRARLPGKTHRLHRAVRYLQTTIAQTKVQR
ncbi:MAG: aminoglycoside phosphotransferase family protein, partial [Pseudomonadota bacterium]